MFMVMKEHVSQCNSVARSCGASWHRGGGWIMLWKGLSQSIWISKNLCSKIGNNINVVVFVQSVLVSHVEPKARVCSVMKVATSP